jgi:hypothetical protein
MNDVILYGSLGLTALLLLALFWRRVELEGSGVEPFAMSLPAASVITRIFSQEDLRYAQTLPRPICRMFERDRQAMAMTWIRQIRYTGILLMRKHVQAARHSSALHIWTEARFAGSVVTILLACELFAFAVVLLGPARLKLLISFLTVRMRALQIELEHSSLAAVHETA